MTEEEYKIDLEYEIFSKAMEVEADKYYRTPWSIKQEMLSVISNWDIAEMIWDKRKEWIMLEWEKKIAMKGLRWDARKIIEGFHLDKQEPLNKFGKGMLYLLKIRTQPTTKEEYTAEDLQRAKDSVSIMDVIEVTAWIRIHNSYKLIKCPFPAHRDKTPSLKIYKNTNSFYCQWCSKWGSQIDFIMNMFQCDVSKAIKQLLQFYKK